MMVTKQRWYERNPLVAEAMHSWQHFPPRLQKILALRVNQGHRWQLWNTHKGSKSPYATHRLLVTYLSQKKRRWYDEDPMVQKTLNYLSQTDHGELVDLSERIIKLHSHIDNQRIQPDNLTRSELDNLVNYVFSNANRIKCW
jgi:hypothetical protein